MLAGSVLLKAAVGTAPPPWLADGGLHGHMAFSSTCVCVPISPISPFKKNTGRIALRRALLEHDLILTNYVSNDHISK